MPNRSPRDSATLLLLDRDDVEALLLADDVLAAVREAFMLHSDGKGQVFPLVREKLSTGGTFGIKSGAVPDQALLGFKAAGFWPANRGIGGEPHQATIFLMDPATGRPLCLIDGNAVTTQRTGAAGGIGLEQLARPDSQSIVVFGTGVQAMVQLDYALRLMPAIQQVQYVSASGLPKPAFEAHFEGRCTLLHSTDANAAVAASDVVITATTGGGALFDLSSVRPGTHFNCVGADTKGKRELPAGMLALSRLFVDDLYQAAQIGELQWSPATACTEIGDVLTGKHQVMRTAADITVFDMTGLALQDLTVAAMLHEQATATGKGRQIAWPW